MADDNGTRIGAITVDRDRNGFNLGELPYSAIKKDQVSNFKTYSEAAEFLAKPLDTAMPSLI